MTGMARCSVQWIRSFELAYPNTGGRAQLVVQPMRKGPAGPRARLGSRMSLPPTCGSMKDLPLGALISVHFNPSLLVANCRPAWPLGSRKKEKRKEELESDARTDRERRRKRSGG